jgi:cytochrome c oxidase subunit 2
MRTEGKGPETVSRSDRPGLYASGYSRLVHAAFDSEMKSRRPQEGKLSVSTECVLFWHTEWLRHSSPCSHYRGGNKVDSVLRIVCLFLLSGSIGIAGSARPANTSQAEQGAQVIEITAKKYEYTPLPIRVKLGAKVQLKITSLDKTHGFKINLYPDGAAEKGDPGLVLSSNEDCFKIEKGTPIVVQFEARRPGTYSFHCCNLCGIGHRGMKGQLIVEP